MIKIIFLLSPTLYVGQHRYGLYALPSLIDLDMTTISSNIEHLLLEGPLVMSHPHTDNKVPLPGDHVFISNIDIANDDYQSIKRTENVIMLGNVHDYIYIVRISLHILYLL